MIAAWMIYCTVIGMLLVGAAHLTEQLVLARGGATRRVWMFALLLAVALPALAVLLRDEAVVPLDAGAAVASPVGTLVLMESVDLLSVADTLLIRLWAGGSMVLGALLVVALVAVALRRRTWTADEVDGVPVLVSDDVGPAVVGILRSRIVLPRWAVAEDAALRTLLLRHEQEHVEAGDTRLVLLAAVLVVAMPWNVALWRLAQRLRTAVEVDCDHRVMTAPGVDVRRYGALLLAVGRRRSARAVMAAIAFSRSRPLLELRIDRMTLRRRCGAVRLAATAAVVALLVGAAWSLPQPVRAADVSGVPYPCPSRSPSSGSSRAPFSSHTAKVDSPVPYRATPA